jgi:hypothetical protein
MSPREPGGIAMDSDRRNARKTGPKGTLGLLDTHAQFDIALTTAER